MVEFWPKTAPGFVQNNRLRLFIALFSLLPGCGSRKAEKAETQRRPEVDGLFRELIKGCSHYYDWR
jgi:hypothetical protein